MTVKTPPINGPVTNVSYCTFIVDHQHVHLQVCTSVAPIIVSAISAKTLVSAVGNSTKCILVTKIYISMEKLWNYVLKRNKNWTKLYIGSAIGIADISDPLLVIGILAKFHIGASLVCTHSHHSTTGGNPLSVLKKQLNLKMSKIKRRCPLYFTTGEKRSGGELCWKWRECLEGRGWDKEGMRTVSWSLGSPTQACSPLGYSMAYHSAL